MHWDEGGMGRGIRVRELWVGGIWVREVWAGGIGVSEGRSLHPNLLRTIRKNNQVWSLITHLMHSEIRKQDRSFPRNTKYKTSISFVFSMNDFHVITNFEELLQLRGREIQRFLKTNNVIVMITSLYTASRVSYNY